MADPGDDDETKASSSRLPVTALPPTPARAQRASIAPSSGSGSAFGTSATSATTVGSPLKALERDEILRTRKFCLIAIVIAIVGGSAVPFLPGDPTASAL